MNRIEEINARKAKIRAALQSDKKVDLDALEKELRELNDEAEQIQRRAQIAAGINEDTLPSSTVNPPAKDTDNSYNSEAYRKAFMKYVCRGGELPVEFRASATTSTDDIGALVPPVTLNKIVEKVEAYGMILPLVNRTAYRTGLTIPVASVKPVASWVAEGKGSDRQKLPLDAAITFGHYKLSCAVSVTIETDEMALSAFEARLVNSISEAMAKAIEQAILNGTGTAQPTGILNDASKGTTFNLASLTYKDLVAAEGALPMEYENNAVWVMSKKTFMEFVGMEDKSGQPIARVNYGLGKAPERTLLGRHVVLTNYLPAFSTSLKKTDVFAMLYNFSDYTLNTNFAVGMRTYVDNDTDDVIRKSIMVVDGKPVQYDSLVKLAGNATA